MSKPKIVTGTDCLKYINKSIGFLHCGGGGSNLSQIAEYFRHRWNTLYCQWNSEGSVLSSLVGQMDIYISLSAWEHDITKRKIGVVTGRSPEGGLQVSILGNEYIQNNKQYMQHSITTFHYLQDFKYDLPLGSLYYILYSKPDGLPSYPSTAHVTTGIRTPVSFNDSFDMSPSFDGYLDIQPLGLTWRVNGQKTGQQAYKLTTDIETTPEFGHIDTFNDNQICYPDMFRDNPLDYFSGNMFAILKDYSNAVISSLPGKIAAGLDYRNVYFDLGLPYTEQTLCNFTSIPYNLILTENRQAALAYLANGTLPNDAFLYPLDWDDLPKYDPDQFDPDDDDGDDDGDDNDDVDKTPLVIPTLTPQMLDANNIYWLGVGEYGQFLTWFWYDIQQFSVIDPTTWDNLLDNLQGLYNNLAQAIISVRYMPIDPSWVGGLSDTDHHIKLAMIEDNTGHNIFNKYAQLKPRDIGSVKVPAHYKMFLDNSPYSQLSLYLPYYGYIDLDIDVFINHTIDIKAVYDILSGTILYYIYRDNKALINYYMAKISVDIPITLQTAYERDKSINQNLTELIVNSGTLVSSIVGGNPIGATISAGNLTSSPSASAPLLTKGYGSEQGILFAPAYCAIYIKQPKRVKKGRAYARTIGNLWCKTAKLSDLEGFTICQNPHIDFNGNAYVTEEGETTDKKLLPLAEEIEEIYDYLTKGVIL